MIVSDSAAALLDIRDLTVHFSAENKSFDVVRHISFSVHAGETVCLVGESGCGKSMTALALLRLVPPPGKIAAASLCLQGRELMHLPESAMQHIRGSDAAMIFQEPMTSLNPVLRIGDQVAEPLVQHKKNSRRQALVRAAELLHEVGLPDPERRLRDYPHQLSGGMRQRVMIAMALACDPVLLLADEPTTALDVTIQGQILDLLARIKAERGMGLLFITHDLGVVAEIADKVCVMYAGSLVEQAAADDLFRKPLHPYTKGLIRCAPTLALLADNARLETIPGMVPAPDALPAGCPFYPRCPEAQACCQNPPPEQIFAGEKSPRTLRCWLKKR